MRTINSISREILHVGGSSLPPLIYSVVIRYSGAEIVSS